MRKRILILGGSGFVGKYIVKELAKNGHIIEIFSRNPRKADELKLCGQVGQITTISGDIQNRAKVIELISNSKLDIIINLVGILYTSKNATHNDINLTAAVKVAELAKNFGIKLIHFSALVNNNNTEYAKSKNTAAEEIKLLYPESIIVKPSVIFGPEDSFFNLFAKIISCFHIFPLIGGGNTLLQPVYVGDVATFIKKIVEQDTPLSNNCILVGPAVWSIKNIVQYISKVIHRKCIYINLPFNLAYLLAFLLETLPAKLFNKLVIMGNYQPILTREQVEELKYDNISAVNTLKEYDINLSTIEDIVPLYLKLYNKN